MQVGVDSFGGVISDPATGLTVSALQRMDSLLDEIVLADQVGLDVFGIGEHHCREFVDSALPCNLWCGRYPHPEHSPNKCCNRSQRRRPRPNLAGIRHSGLDLPSLRFTVSATAA